MFVHLCLQTRGYETSSRLAGSTIQSAIVARIILYYYYKKKLYHMMQHRSDPWWENDFWQCVGLVLIQHHLEFGQLRTFIDISSRKSTMAEWWSSQPLVTTIVPGWFIMELCSITMFKYLRQLITNIYEQLRK